MSRWNWKRVQPRDLRNAMDLCLEFARDKHNRSVDSIADLMGLSSKWTLYKWIESANLPVRLIIPFELACGIDFVSQWLVHRSGKLVIEVPVGANCKARDIAALQAAYHEAVGELMRFYRDFADLDQALGALQTALEMSVWHRLNVEKSRQPELPFDEE